MNDTTLLTTGERRAVRLERVFCPIRRPWCGGPSPIATSFDGPPAAYKGG